jgi:hypothetical protein
MTAEYPIHWISRETDSPEKRTRLAELDGYIQSRCDAITARVAPHRAAIKVMVRHVLDDTVSMSAKILAIWELADFMGRFTAGDVACKRGCSHCCHIAVLVPKQEAEVIAHRVGRKPATVPPRMDAQHIEWGYHNPCPFLRDGECSIYESRPLVCRAHYSVDKDELLCSLSPPHSNSVPLLNTSELTKLLFMVVSRGGRRVPHFADIREWFPR